MPDSESNGRSFPDPDPCPFCGAETDMVCAMMKNLLDEIQMVIHCTKCGTVGPPSEPTDDPKAAEAQARRRWDGRRKPEDARIDVD